MSPEDAIIYLKRYLRWRRGEGPRDFAKAGFDCQTVGEALEAVIGQNQKQAAELIRVRARLHRSDCKREEYRLRLLARCGDTPGEA